MAPARCLSQAHFRTANLQPTYYRIQSGGFLRICRPPLPGRTPRPARDRAAGSAASEPCRSTATRFPPPAHRGLPVGPGHRSCHPGGIRVLRLNIRWPLRESPARTPRLSRSGKPPYGRGVRAGRPGPGSARGLPAPQRSESLRTTPAAGLSFELLPRGALADDGQAGVATRRQPAQRVDQEVETLERLQTPYRDYLRPREVPRSRVGLFRSATGHFEVQRVVRHHDSRAPRRSRHLPRWRCRRRWRSRGSRAGLRARRSATSGRSVSRIARFRYLIRAR